jgi:hypothetical protein
MAAADKSGVGIQERNYGGHVRAADGDDHEQAKDQRQNNDQRVEIDALGMQDQDYCDNYGDEDKTQPCRQG